MKTDKNTELYFTKLEQPTSQSRRNFLKKLGGGVIVVFCLGKLSIIEGFGQNTSKDLLNFNAYLRVKEDGRVDCYTGKIEMGQGITTSLAQVLAEELEISIYSIDMIMGDTELCPYDAGTWGSLTTRFTDPVLRCLTNYKTQSKPILFGFDFTADCNDNIFYLINQVLRFLRDKPNQNYLFCSISLRHDNFELNKQAGLKIIWEGKKGKNKYGLEIAPRFQEGNLKDFLSE